MDRLKDFIIYYCNLNEQELEFVLRQFSFRNIRKGSHILRKGQTCNELVYIEKGNFRIYYKDEQNKEITSWIAFDDMLATEPASFLHNFQQNSMLKLSQIVDLLQ